MAMGSFQLQKTHNNIIELVFCRVGKYKYFSICALNVVGEGSKGYLKYFKTIHINTTLKKKLTEELHTN